MIGKTNIMSLRRFNSFSGAVLGWSLLIGLSAAGWYWIDTLSGRVLAILAALWWVAGLVVLIVEARRWLKSRAK
jgi:hypothetical protein